MVEKVCIIDNEAFKKIPEEYSLSPCDYCYSDKCLYAVNGVKPDYWKIKEDAINTDMSEYASEERV